MTLIQHPVAMINYVYNYVYNHVSPHNIKKNKILLQLVHLLQYSTAYTAYILLLYF